MDFFHGPTILYNISKVHMKKHWFLFSAFFFLFLPGSMAARDTDHRWYGSVSYYLNATFGIDPNAGLTAFPILRIPMGGRSEGMAGAFSAVADDISFLDHNPAASSMLERTEIALFHNNWIADANIAALAFTSRRDDLGFAAGVKWLYVPFTEYNMFGNRVSKGYYSEGVATLNISYNFLRGHYFSGLSVGVNLKGAFRIVPDFSDADDMGNNQGAIIPGSGREQSTIMGMVDIGLLTRFNFLKFYNSRQRNASAALVFRNLGPPAMGDPLPSAITAGLSYRPVRPLLFSFDFTVPMNFVDISLSERPYWAFGIAGEVASFLSMRAGLQGRAGNARITVGSAINLERISLEVNYTLDLATQIQPMNRVSLGVRLNLGDQCRRARAEKVEELYLIGLEAYSRSDFYTARSRWEEALRLDPRFDPAREGLRIIERTLEVEERIRAMQELMF